MAKDIGKSIEDLQEKMDEIADQLHKIDKDTALHSLTLMEHLKMHERTYEEFKRSIDVLEANTNSLKEHMHRTELLETFVHKMNDRLMPIEVAQIEAAAIKKHKHETMVRWGKIIGSILGLIGIAAALKPLIIKLLIP